jgi:DNA repair exonuclease SbcCD ATPase subunit
VEKWKGIIDEEKLLRAAMDKLRGDYSDKHSKLVVVTTNIESISTHIRELTTKTLGAPTKEQAEKAHQAFLAAQTALQRISDLKVDYGITIGRFTDSEVVLKRMTEEVSKVAPLEKWKAMLSEAKDLFHKNAVPSEVVAWYASELIQHTLSYLKVFDINFSVVVTSDLLLMAVFPDKCMPVSALSGGEKNMLNICMRLAMADLFPGDLQLLVLDEVEVHLDQTNVGKLPVLLDKIKGLSRNRGIVVLFVSHSPFLKDTADHSIVC